MKTKLLILFTMMALIAPVRAIDNSPVDGSSTITSGGASQLVFGANPSRRWLLVQNHSSETLYLNFGATATSAGNSIMLAANGGAYENPSNYCPTGTVTIIGATTGSKYLAKQGG